jgi:hypothetical protein
VTAALRLAHVELAEANAFVALHHRHHKPVVGHRFSLGVTLGGILCGVAICGRPVARVTDYKSVIEVTRLCTDGTKNACSFLYAASARAALALGFSKIQTFILIEEPGVTLEAAGWRLESYSDGGDWTSATHENRRQDQPQGRKQKWVKRLSTNEKRRKENGDE